MKETIEYLIVGTLILIILSFIATQNLFTPSKATNQISQERLKDETEKILDTILTSPGNPSNWGSTYVIGYKKNIQVVSVNSTSFGLAADMSQMYSLSATKISYLKYLQDTGVLNSQNIVKITGINKPFNLKIIPALKVNVTQIDNTLTFKIIVKTYDDKPAFNANVTGFLIYVSGSGNKISVNYARNSSLTTLNGTAPLVFSVPSLNSWALVVYVSWGLFRNVIAYYNTSSQVINGYILGNSLILYMPSEETNPSARHVSGNVTVGLSQKIITVQWDTTQGENNNVINKGAKYILSIDLSEALSGTDLSDIIFIAGGIRYNGNNYYTFIVFQIPIFPNNSTILTLSNINNVLRAYSTQRLVSINGMTYVVQFTLGES